MSRPDSIQSPLPIPSFLHVTTLKGHRPRMHGDIMVTSNPDSDGTLEVVDGEVIEGGTASMATLASGCWFFCGLEYDSVVSFDIEEVVSGLT